MGTIGTVGTSTHGIYSTQSTHDTNSTHSTYSTHGTRGTYSTHSTYGTAQSKIDIRARSFNLKCVSFMYQLAFYLRAARQSFNKLWAKYVHKFATLACMHFAHVMDTQMELACSALRAC